MAPFAAAADRYLALLDRLASTLTAAALGVTIGVDPDTLLAQAPTAEPKDAVQSKADQLRARQHKTAQLKAEQLKIDQPKTSK